MQHQAAYDHHPTDSDKDWALSGPHCHAGWKRQTDIQTFTTGFHQRGFLIST
jgi:hypothetical protein